MTVYTKRLLEIFPEFPVKPGRGYVGLLVALLAMLPRPTEHSDSGAHGQENRHSHAED